MNRLAPYSKAIAAFIAPGAALIIADGGTLSGHDWLVVAATCIVSSAVTAVAPKNKPAPK
jgi:hypothetical protein